MLDALKRHWPEYLMEAAGLGLFMISAAVFATVLEYPGSPLHKAIPDPLVRRALMGLAMGLTAIGLIYSPWGHESGAHVRVGLVGPRLDGVVGVLQRADPRHAPGGGVLPETEGRS